MLELGRTSEIFLINLLIVQMTNRSKGLSRSLAPGTTEEVARPGLEAGGLTCSLVPFVFHGFSPNTCLERQAVGMTGWVSFTHCVQVGLSQAREQTPCKGVAAAACCHVGNAYLVSFFFFLRKTRNLDLKKLYNILTSSNLKQTMFSPVITHV